MSKSRPGRRPLVESLEHRWLMASVGQLLAYDFNGTTAWAQSGSVSSTGVTAATSQAAVGTIDTEGGTTPTGGISLTATPPTSGAWRSDFTSGRLPVANTEVNLGKLTLSFSLSASQARPVTLRVVSYDASGQATGALATRVDPAAANSYQRFAVDLSTMNPSGSGTFNPTAPQVSFNFEIGSLAGWSASQACALRVDNVNYSRPALYVSSIDGDNNDNGTTEQRAFATIQKALDASQPGDIILVKGDAANPYNVLGERTLVTRGGSPAAWVSLKNYPGQTPRIYSEAWSAIQIGAYALSTAPAIGYVEIRGLHLQGGSAKVGTRSAPDGPYDPTAPNADQYGPYAQYLQNIDPLTGRNNGGTADPRTNGNGVSVDGGNEANKPHDIRIADNLVEDFPGGGIGAGASDRVQIEDNVVRDNSYWDKYATSGISILSTYSFDGTSGTVTRLVRGNVSSGNIHKMKWVRNDPALTQYSDGNGIIIDVNHDADNAALGRTLVTNNVVFDNGGSGIHAYKADYVDIVNNTAYLNSASPYLQYGQIFANQSYDVRVYNNILVAPVATGGMPDEYVNGGDKPTGANKIVYRNNVYFGGDVTGWAADAYNVGNVTADPKFAVASVNATVADFRLRSGSPAVNAGSGSTIVPRRDVLGNVRNGTTDVGAYEYYAATPTIVGAASALPSPVTGKTTTLTVTAGDNDGPDGLTHTWSVTAKPTGASNPTFDRNGAATASTAIATFDRAGTYSLLVTVRDANGLTTTSALSVVVAQTLSGLAITPTGATVAAGSTQQYAVAGIDQFGQAMATGAVAWSTSAGNSIGTNGLFTAGATLGPFGVTAVAGGFTATVAGSVFDGTAPTWTAAASRKVHGTAGTFDKQLNLSGTRSVEPRLGGATQLIFTFSEPIKANDGTISANEFTVANATFSSATITGNTLTLNLTSPTNGRYATIALAGLTDVAGNVLGGTATLSVGNLLGDANGNGSVTGSDQLLVKNSLLRPISSTNFLSDLNLSGSITGSDQVLLKSNLLGVLL